MDRVRVLLAVVFSAASVAFGGEPLRVVATTGMVADLVRNVAGERAEVTGLMGPGVDPHLYKATRTDTAALMRADLVFYNGLMLEGKMTDALIRAATAGRKVYAVTELLDESDLLEPEEFAGQYDPHVWMDPSSWSRAVVVVRDKLTEADPSGAEQYRANAERYAQTLRELDEYAQRVLSGVPEERRVLVTAHDAFNYFGRRYGFEVVGIQGLSTESEAGVRDIERIVGLIVSCRISAVFVESTVSDRNVRALIDGARSRGWTVVIGGRLFSDAMGTPGTYEGTYLGMIDHNVTTIARALGGDAPAGGMNGRLAGKE
ncbi:MAG: zinc ABC transporter substrate-binding protein [Phycisphaeraceae bacterium]|nr:zinc ABC transporter substrate-binding protein [Phycisphaeraceae bacterium]